MANIGIYYGSDSGNTESIAKELAKGLNVSKDNLFDVSSATADFSAYDVVLFGTSTMGIGDLQDDWDSFIDKVKKADLSGKKVALFGCGDSMSYGDSFCDAVSIIYNAVKDKGCSIIGKTSDEGYTYDSSEAFIDGKFVGLLIDEDNESSMTSERINAWLEGLKEKI